MPVPSGDTVAGMTAPVEPGPPTLHDVVFGGRVLARDQVHSLLVELCRLVDVDPHHPRLARPWEVLVGGGRVGLTAGGRGSPATAVLALVDIAWLALAGPVERDTPRRRQRMVEVAGVDFGGLLADVLLDPAAWSPARLGSELALCQRGTVDAAIGAHRVGRHRQPAAPETALGSPRRVRVLPRSQPLRVVAGSAGLALVVAGALGTVRAGWYAGPGSEGTAGAGVTATVASHPRLVPVTSTPSHTRSGLPAALTDPVIGDPDATLQAALAVRSEALMSGRLDALVEALAPDSAQFAADRALVGQLAGARERYDRLAFVVRSARVTRRSGAVVWVAAVVDRSAYLVIDATDRQVTRPSAPGRALVYELRLVAGRWRLAGVSEEAAASRLS